MTIAPNIIRETTRGGDRLALEGFIPYGTPGDPELPFYPMTFLLPQEIAWETVSASVENPIWESIPGEFDIAPAPPPATTQQDRSPKIVWGNKNPQTIIDGRDMTVYQRDTWFPAHPLGAIEPSKYRQWNLVKISLFPIAYNPVKKTLRLLRSGTILIQFVSPPLTLQAHPGHERFWQYLKPQIENAHDQEKFYPPLVPPLTSDVGQPSPTNPNYLIITTSAIVSASTRLSNFVAHKQSRGYTVAVITESATADDTHYLTGNSAASRVANIRSWLQNRYASWGIQYVLLIGNPHPTSFSSSSSIPMMMCYPHYSSSSDYENSPTDMAYAELSGSWDLDGDGKPGEFSGDFGSGGIDRDAEVAVGRIPYYDSITDLDNILQKMINYETASGPQDWRKKMLIPAAISNFAPEDHNNDGDVFDSGEWPFFFYRTFGADWGESMKSLATTNGYGAYTLYERTGVYSDGSAYPLTKCNAQLNQSNLQTAWQNTYGFVGWWGHGNSIGAYRRTWFTDPTYVNMTQHPQETSDSAFWTSFNCSSLSNTSPSFVVQVSCTNGAPESTNNLGYALLKNGAIGTVSASRVSWYAVGSWTTSKGASYGDNASYAYYLFKRMIENKDRVGDALNSIKSSFGMGWGWQSWMNCLDFNLYGDPSTNQEQTSNSYLLWTK